MTNDPAAPIHIFMDVSPERSSFPASISVQSFPDTVLSTSIERSLSSHFSLSIDGFC
jgi:hypothetical protein